MVTIDPNNPNNPVDPSLLGPNTSRPMHLGDTSRNNQFNGFAGNILGHEGIPTKQSAIPPDPTLITDPNDPTLIT